MNFLAVFLGILPGLLWLVFYLQEDPHPEPKHLILGGFLLGGLSSVSVIILQYLTEDTLDLLKIKNFIISLVILALIEEVCKFATAFWLSKETAEFDEPVDAMIYLITIALGFATVENILFVGNVFYLNAGIILSEAFGVIALRFIGATLLHALASGLAGYYWARGLVKGNLLRNVGQGLFWAVLVHSIFNFLILKYHLINLLYPSLFLILVAIFVFIEFEKLKTFNFQINK